MRFSAEDEADKSQEPQGWPGALSYHWTLPLDDGSILVVYGYPTQRLPYWKGCIAAASSRLDG